MPTATPGCRRPDAMSIERFPGIAGYEEKGEALFARFESLSFDAVHARLRHLFPPPPARVLDVGAGSGRDAAALAAAGHRVTAVEPSSALRERAIARHASPRIAWLDDGLPDLGSLPADAAFDLVLLSGVWHHLDAEERDRAMRRLAALLSPGGRLLLSLRHGPAMPDRRVFAVDAEESCRQARAADLAKVLEAQGESIQAENRAAGVTWTFLAFERPARG